MIQSVHSSNTFSWVVESHIARCSFHTNGWSHQQKQCSLLWCWLQQRPRDMTKPQLDLRTSNNVKFWLLSYQFGTSIKLKLNSKLLMFPIKLILGISTKGYYKFDMTKPQLDLRTSNDVKFWLLSYRFWTSIKLKLNSKLQMFPIKLILGISTEGYYQFDMTKP